MQLKCGLPYRDRHAYSLTSLIVKLLVEGDAVVQPEEVIQRGAMNYLSVSHVPAAHRALCEDTPATRN